MLDRTAGMLQSAMARGFQAAALNDPQPPAELSVARRAYNGVGKFARQPPCVMRAEESPGPTERDAG